MSRDRPTEPGRRDRSMWPWVLGILALLAVVAWLGFSWWGGREGGETWRRDAELPKAAREAPDVPPPPPAPALALNAFTADCVEADPPADPPRAATYAATCAGYAAETLRAAAGVRGAASTVEAELAALDRAVAELTRAAEAGADPAAAEPAAEAAGDAPATEPALEPAAAPPAAAAARAAVAATVALGAPAGVDPLDDAQVAQAEEAVLQVAAADNEEALVAALRAFHQHLRPLVRATVARARNGG